MTGTGTMKILLYIAIGLTIGTLSGMLGIGGGVLLVPALIWLCGFTYPRAAGTSLAILVPPIGLPAALRAFRDDRVDLAAAVWIAGSFAVGAYGGAATLRYLHPEYLRVGLGLVMLYIGVRFIVDSNSETANAAAGLTAVALGLIGYWGLRVLGRKHLARPELGRHIRKAEEEGRGNIDYHI
jgi:uncharacterized membrane protein YfcA